METKIRKIIGFLGSRWMFGATVVLFTLESGWLAITSRFPMAFDEAYHLGLIQFFSHHWNPIITSQPPSTYTYKFGSIVQDPSWLYHYLMSFPYRLMELFTSSPVAQVVGLRLIDVALMVVNLFLLRKLLRLTRLSGALTNVAILIFALTPMVTVLSAQISYDNLIIPLTTLSFYETILVIRELRQRAFNVRRVLGLLCLCLLASIVKYAFLPILLAVSIVVAWKLIVYWRADRARLLHQTAESFNQSGIFAKTALLLVTVLSIFLFCRFYGVNIIRYHNPVPQCNQLLSKRDCLQNYSWNINYSVQQYAQAHPASVIHVSVERFTIINWMFYMSEQLYGAIIPIKGLSYLSSPLYSAVLLTFIGSTVCVIMNFKKIFRGHPELMTLLFTSGIYLLFLWGRNYWDYRQLGQPMAISGRYLVPVLICLYGTFGLGISYALSLGRNGLANALKSALAVVVIVVFVGFGGLTQYVTLVTPKYGRLNDTNNFIL